MNTYDPANFIVYVKMDCGVRVSEPPAVRVAVEHPLPSGYANGSPRTRLRRPTSAGLPAVTRTLGGSA
jgi:hypothetical protein